MLGAVIAVNGLVIFATLLLLGASSSEVPEGCMLIGGVATGVGGLFVLVGVIMLSGRLSRRRDLTRRIEDLALQVGPGASRFLPTDQRMAAMLTPAGFALRF